MKIGDQHLTPVERTAFLTLYAHALDSRRSRPILGDHAADRTVNNVDYDFTGLGVRTSVVCQTALRAKMLDDRLRTFVAAHPDAVVVDLGVGLDNRRGRVQTPPTVDWFGIDLPGMTRLRQKVVSDGPYAHSIGMSVAESGWTDPIPRDRPTMLLADGLLAFLSEEVIVALFHRITDHFATGELAFNDYGGIGWISQVALKVAPQKMFKDVGASWGYLGFKDAHHPETWNPRLRLVEEASLTHAPEVALFPRWLGLATRLMGTTKTGARKARILRYQF